MQYKSAVVPTHYTTSEVVILCVCQCCYSSSGASVTTLHGYKTHRGSQIQETHKPIAQITVFTPSEHHSFCKRILPYSRELAESRYKQTTLFEN